MTSVNVHEAKTHLSELLVRVAGGEEIVISRYGRPVAMLVARRETAVQREGGKDRGLFDVSDTFDEEVPEVTKAFES
jgi:prevent-host-death family protein